jgi:hypothetical protein
MLHQQASSGKPVYLGHGLLLGSWTQESKIELRSQLKTFLKRQLLQNVKVRTSLHRCVKRSIKEPLQEPPGQTRNCQIRKEAGHNMHCMQSNGKSEASPMLGPPRRMMPHAVSVQLLLCTENPVFLSPP